MRKLIGLITAIGIGIAAGVAFFLQFKGIANKEFFGEHYEQAMQAGREAAAKKRQELEATGVDLSSTSTQNDYNNDSERET